MSDPEDAVIYRYEPHFDGEFFQGIPARDLTQADVDRMDPVQQRDAFAPHPLYETPLYVAVGGDEKKAQDKQIEQLEKAAKAAEKDGKA